MHLVPALVEHNGPAAVSAYFQPQPTGTSDVEQFCRLAHWLWLVVKLRLFGYCKALCNLCRPRAAMDIQLAWPFLLGAHFVLQGP